MLIDKGMITLTLEAADSAELARICNTAINFQNNEPPGWRIFANLFKACAIAAAAQTHLPMEAYSTLAKLLVEDGIFTESEVE